MLETIVFVPGLMCTGELFAPQISALGDRFRYQIADQGEHDDIRACAAAILDRAPERFIPIGLSMGGYIVQEMLRQAPDRMDCFILMDTSARADTDQARQARFDQIALAQDKGMDAVVEALAPSMFGRSNRGDADLLDISRGMANDTGVARFIRQQHLIMSRIDSRPDLAAFDKPALVVVGEEDVLTPPKLAEELADGLPQAELVYIPEAGHLATLEAPEAVNAVLQDFLLGD